MDNEWHKQYNKNRYHKIRHDTIEKLGGKCAQCSSVDNLEIDHVDKATKSFELGRLLNISKEQRDKEVDKCQLLCKPCHIKKSSKESTVGHGGGTTGVKNCRCDLCRPLKNAYMREYKRRKKYG